MSDKKLEHVVVWSGRDSLLPDRAERWDPRFGTMPSLDPDDDGKATRKYTYTGRHKRTKETNNGNDPRGNTGSNT